jgi:hypothetical protein
VAGRARAAAARGGEKAAAMEAARAAVAMAVAMAKEDLAGVARVGME